MMRAATIVPALVLVLEFALATGAPAEAQTFEFTVSLSGANEAPDRVVTGAFGEGVVTWSRSRRTLTWVIDVYNIPSGSTAAHFHVGGPGVAGPIVVPIDIPPTISNDFRLAGSAACDALVPRPAQGVNSCEDLEQSLMGGQIYVNIHTAANPAGEVRGQVLLKR